MATLLATSLIVAIPSTAAAATVVLGGSYDNTSALVTYTGTWGSTSSGSDSGGSIATLAAPGSAELAFNEHSITWVARKASSFGIAAVYLDARLVATVDLYAATSTFQAVVYTSPTLAYGTHTLRIERTGNKNSASSGRTIDLDALVVPDTRAPATPTKLTAIADGAAGRLTWTASPDPDVAGYRVYRTSGTSTTYRTLNADPVTATSYLDPALTPGVRYRYQVSALDKTGNESLRTADATLTSMATAVGPGTYENTASDLQLSGTWGSATSASDSGGSVATLADTGFAQLAFKETSVTWYARKGGSFGIANVYLDGTLVTTVDLYAADNTYRAAVYTSPTLTRTIHTLRIERSGLKNAASLGRTIDVDSVVVADTQAPGAPTGLVATAEGANARLGWTANPEPDVAGYRVYRASGTDATFRALTPSPVTTPSYLDPGLTPDVSYRYQVTAVDGAGNESPPSEVRTLASAAQATGAGTFEDSSPAITTYGDWVTSSSTSYSGGSITTLGATGFAQIAFRETSVKWVALKGSALGIANVYLDGTLVTTVDLYAPANLYRATVYSSPTLAYGTHTLRIERAGTKNAASAGRNIDVDSFLVPDSRAPATPTGLTAAAEGAGNRLTWAASVEPDLAGYRIYRAVGSSATYELLTVAPLAATTYFDPDLAPNADYRYRVSAVDQTGNESDRTADVVARTAVTHGTYESEGSAVSLVGAWVTTSDPTASGDSVQTLTSEGSASLTFNETGVRWIGSKTPTSGIAQVTLDGTLVASVDQYSATAQSGVALYEVTSLKPGAHTLSVAWTAQHNPAVSTSSPATVVDAFVVDDTTPPGVPQALWAQPAGGGIHLEWAQAVDNDTAGYLVYRARGATGAFVLLSVDNPLQDTVLFDDGLDAGITYRYQVAAVDVAGNQSRLSVVVPATTAVGTGTLENTSDPVLYSTPWTLTSSSRDSGGNSSVLTVPGDASLTFSGTGIKWVTRKNNFSGIATVYLDDLPAKSVDLYADTQVYQVTAFSSLALAEGNHKIRIERSGNKNAASSGRGISLDSFIVLDSTPPRPMAAPALTTTRSGIKLSWDASAAPDVESYRLYRTTGTDPEILLATVPLLQLNFLDVGLADSTAYSYRITAVDTSGNESTSAGSAQATSASPPPVVQERYANCPAATRTVSTSGTLQNALNLAGPGEVIQLAPGRYTGYFTVATGGTADRPIWVCGPRTAVVDFGRTTSGFGIFLNNVSHVVVTGMTIRNVQKGVIVAGGSYNTISDVALESIGEEAIHLRSNTTDDMVIGNTITNTGLLTPGYGEGVYVGSDPTNWCTYSDCNPDQSDRNSIVDNTISGTTAEGVEAKAGTVDGLVQGNTVDGALMTSPNSGGWIVIKGNNWLVKSNTGTNAPENGFQATLSKAPFWGRSNVFVQNFSTLNNPIGYGTWVQKGIGNVAACSENTADGLRKTNIACQR